MVRRRRAREPRNGELADEEIPVGVTGPLHIPLVRQIEGQLYIARHQLICDGSIVDAMDRNKPSTGIAVMESVADRFEAANINYGDAQPG